MEGRVWPQERRWEAASGPPPAQRGSLRPREEKALAQGHTALMRQPLSGSRKLGSAMGCDTGWPPPSLSLVSCSAGLPPCPDCVGPFASGTSALPGWVESRKTLGQVSPAWSRASPLETVCCPLVATKDSTFLSVSEEILPRGCRCPVSGPVSTLLVSRPTWRPYLLLQCPTTQRRQRSKKYRVMSKITGFETGRATFQPV